MIFRSAIRNGGPQERAGAGAEEIARNFHHNGEKLADAGQENFGGNPEVSEDAGKFFAVFEKAVATH